MQHSCACSIAVEAQICGESLHNPNCQGDFLCACTPRAAYEELWGRLLHSEPQPCTVPRIPLCPRAVLLPSALCSSPCRSQQSLSTLVQGPTLHTAAGLGAGHRCSSLTALSSALRVPAAPSPVQSHQDIDDPTEGDEQPQDEAEQHQRLRLLGRYLGLGQVPTAERSTGLVWGEGERSAGSWPEAGAERGPSLPRVNTGGQRVRSAGSRTTSPAPTPPGSPWAAAGRRLEALCQEAPRTARTECGSAAVCTRGGRGEQAWLRTAVQGSGCCMKGGGWGWGWG